jgi:hypothetical protein
METVKSADGTVITCGRAGDGPSLIVSVGAFGTRVAGRRGWPAGRGHHPHSDRLLRGTPVARAGQDTTNAQISHPWGNPRAWTGGTLARHGRVGRASLRRGP